MFESRRFNEICCAELSVCSSISVYLSAFLSLPRSLAHLHILSLAHSLTRSLVTTLSSNPRAMMHSSDSQGRVHSQPSDQHSQRRDGCQLDAHQGHLQMINVSTELLAVSLGSSRPNTIRISVHGIAYLAGAYDGRNWNISCIYTGVVVWSKLRGCGGARGLHDIARMQI